jgi:hypothetical protein
MDIFEIDELVKYKIIPTEVEAFRRWLMMTSTALVVFTPITKLVDLKNASILNSVYSKLHKATGKKGWFLRDFLTIKLTMVEAETLYELLETQEEFWSAFESIYKQIHERHNRHFTWERQRENKSATPPVKMLHDGS